ncbi:eukaryotic translation initiation factor 3 subunit A [Tremella mesenterica]|uniref:Eukaryotic translation initiation factor 3 subunit A n=1 Tax=Tremella mesenterica TaxID=5217 RepID=A0A4Q1BT35_TREME|nr:eukaryotic translation initiation factor 3 subunit A [Tremella mesenterica]
MPPIYVKPENALKRSEELLALGTPQAEQQAFENLTEVFHSKRFKQTAVSTLEPIVMRFLDFCVRYHSKQLAKDGLLTFKNTAQTTNIPSIEKVITHLIDKAETKLAEAMKQAETEVAALPATSDNDDLPLQPSALLLDTFIDSAGDRERIERRLIAPAQKFCWDAYDIALDVAKGNDRLEIVYQNIAYRAFEFCKTHQRKNDFRRLCEQRLRKDLSNAAKYAHQQHSINLSDPETFTRHLDTRFLQLETAVQLELWQEAFRSVEDIHGLVAGRKVAKPSMMATYYEKLTQIFKAEGGKQTAVFHAAAWSRYYQSAERAGTVTDKAAGCVLLSALAVPLGAVETKQRLVSLLNLPKMPTREALVSDAAAKHLRRVPPTIRQLYQIIEVDFQPLKACSNLAPLLSTLSAEYEPYLPALRDVVLSRLLQELSQVYDTVSLSHILSLVKPFDGTAWATDMPALEKFLMSACRQGDIDATVDHGAQSISFVAPNSDTNRLSDLAVCLYNTIQYLNPPTSSRAEAFAAAIEAAEEDKKQAAHRRQIVVKRRELMEEAKLRRDKEESTARAERARSLAEENARRLKELEQANAKAQLQETIEASRREEARKLAETLAARSGFKVDLKAVEDLDTNEIVQLQVEQFAKEKREMTEKMRIVGKRLDHYERALRKVERPLVGVDYERQKEEDRVEHEKGVQQARETAIATHKEALETKERLSRMLPDYLVVRQAVESKRDAEFQKARMSAQRKVEEEKAKFKAQVLKRRAEEKQRREEELREAEEAERLALEREETERVALAERQEAEERAKEEARVKAEAEAERKRKAAEEREAQRAKDLELIRRQQEREREAEERRNRGLRTGSPSVAPTAAPTVTPTQVRPGTWREREAAKKAEGTSGSATASPVAPASPAAGAPGGTNGPTDGATGVYKPGMWRGRGRGGGMAPPSEGRTPSGRGGERW